jgi:hypothetical protein
MASCAQQGDSRLEVAGDLCAPNVPTAYQVCNGTVPRHTAAPILPQTAARVISLQNLLACVDEHEPVDREYQA